MKGKKGSEKYLSIWWYFCLAVILVGIVVAVMRFQTITNVSELDADVLASRVLSCVVENGKLIFDISQLPKADVKSLCKISFREGKDYFIGLELYDFANCKEVNDTEQLIECSLKAKNYASSENQKIDLMDRCINLEGVRTSLMPVCSYKNILIEDSGRNFILRVIGGTYER